MTVQPMINDRSAEDFAQTMLSHLTGSAVSMMTSVGHRTGLFDAMSTLSPSTSHEIARAASLDERYVREWLSAMTTAGIVEYNPSSRRFSLPPEHALSLTRAAGTSNLATYAQLLSAIGAVEDELVRCFREGGGVPYSAYRRFDEVMAEVGDPSRERTVASLGTLSPTLVQRLDAGADALEIGCGRGYASVLLAKRFPRSRFLGIDISMGAIDVARRRARGEGLENVRFEVVDAAALEETSRYGAVFSFDAIHDQAQPELVLKNVHRALRPSGVFLMAEPQGASELQHNLDFPLAPMFYTISTFHCMTVSLSQNGHGLGAMWGEELAVKTLAAIGFVDIRVKALDDDPGSTYFLSHKKLLSHNGEETWTS